MKAETEKTYSFNNSHDPDVPVDYWFQNPPEGMTLFVVFYTKTCQWNQCLGCNLPSMVSEHHVSFHHIMKQVDHVFENVLDDEKKTSLKKIIISNNGSILDEDTFSTTALLYFLAKMNISCSNVHTLTIETRPEYVDFAELEVMARALAEGDIPTKLEIAIGFEAFDDELRNVHFKKGLNLDVFETFVSLVSKHYFTLKTYFMLKPVPGISESDAIEDIKKGIDYLDALARKKGIEINMHLNPTYAAKGTPLADAFVDGSFVPPKLESVVDIIRHAKGKSISLFIGLYDEGLAVPGGSFVREGDEGLVERLEEFNRNQNFDLF